MEWPTCGGTLPVALARHGSHEGVVVLKQMLDRQYVEQTVKRDVRWTRIRIRWPT
jgi:hypothetical protein